MLPTGALAVEARVSMRALLIILLCLPACSPPAPPPTELRGDGWTLIALDGGTLAYSRAGTELITLPPDAFQVGAVSRLEDTSSYDPYCWW